MKKHNDNNHARYLRMLGRRKAGEILDEVKTRRLDAWLARLKELNKVVAYDPEYPANPESHNGGFHLVPREPRDGNPDLDEMVRWPDAADAESVKDDQVNHV
jgi:hypothetical protein